MSIIYPLSVYMYPFRLVKGFKGAKWITQASYIVRVYYYTILNQCLASKRPSYHHNVRVFYMLTFCPLHQSPVANSFRATIKTTLHGPFALP